MMKKLLALATMSLVAAQSLRSQDLPKPSPSAEVSQTVGLTNVKVVYSRPSVKGRVVWGDLVPYNQIWRAGANKATAITLSDEAVIGGTLVPAGSYSIFMIPNDKGPWTIIFNKKTELWGADEYKQEEDVARFLVEPKINSGHAETMEFHFTRVDSKSATLSMDWEKVRIDLEFVCDPTPKAMANIEKAIVEAKEEDKWRVYRNAAGYAKDIPSMSDQGIQWVEKSIALKETWYAHWLHGMLLANKGQYKEAVTKAEIAIRVGKADAQANNKEFTYEAQIRADIDKWKATK